jgi:hypothetical protein
MGVTVMDMNDYTLQIVAEARLAELRADAEHWHRVAAWRPPSPRLRDAVGRMLAHVGWRLLGVGDDSLSATRS